MKHILIGALCALAVTAANAETRTFESADGRSTFGLDTADITDVGYGVRMSTVHSQKGEGLLIVDCDKWNASIIDNSGQTLYQKLEPGTILHSIAVVVCGAAIGGKKRAGLPS